VQQDICRYEQEGLADAYPPCVGRIQVMGNNWPDPHPRNSRPANTVLEQVYSHPVVARHVRDKFMSMVYDGMRAKSRSSAAPRQSVACPLRSLDVMCWEKREFY
jgi:hypothetical protein